MKALFRVSLTIVLAVAFFAGLATVATGPIVAATPLPYPTNKPCPW